MFPNILFYTTPLNEHSGGIANCYLFVKLCREKNINIFLCPILKTIPSLGFFSPFDNKSLDEISQQEINNYFNNDSSFKDIIVNIDTLKHRDNIIIYTEDVEGNPAEQKFVVRWLHFFPNPNAAKTYSYESDYICFFSDYIFNLYDNLCGNLNIHNFIKPHIIKPNILRVFHFKKNTYKNFNDNFKIEREGRCLVVRKGYPPASFRNNDLEFNNYSNNIISENAKLGFDIIGHGITHSDMIKLFNKKQLFLSFDPFTFTLVIASLCGCDSVVVKIPNLTKEEWQNSDPFHKYGIAYGIDDIEEAIKTRHKLEEHVYNMYLENNANIDNFIGSIKEFFNLLVV